MGRVVGEVQEERIAIAVGYELDGAVGEDVGEVAVQAGGGAVVYDGLEVFVVQAGGVHAKVVVSARQKAVEVVKAAIERVKGGRRAQLPFAHDAGAIAGALEMRGECFFLRGQAQVAVKGRVGDVDFHAVAGGIAAGEQRGAGRPAGGMGDVAVGEDYALAGNAVYVGRLDVGSAGETHIAVAEVVHEYDDDVGDGAVLLGAGPEQVGEGEAVGAAHKRECQQQCAP